MLDLGRVPVYVSRIAVLLQVLLFCCNEDTSVCVATAYLIMFQLCGTLCKLVRFIYRITIAFLSNSQGRVQKEYVIESILAHTVLCTRDCYQRDALANGTSSRGTHTCVLAEFARPSNKSSRLITYSFVRLVNLTFNAMPAGPGSLSGGMAPKRRKHHETRSNLAADDYLHSSTASCPSGTARSRFVAVTSFLHTDEPIFSFDAYSGAAVGATASPGTSAKSKSSQCRIPNRHPILHATTTSGKH